MTNWTKHTGTERPSELAPAQIVEWNINMDPMNGMHEKDRADAITWLSSPGMGCIYYRPALDPDGLPYVSADGLEDWAEYVAVQDCAIGGLRPLQFRNKPERIKPSLIAPEYWRDGHDQGRVDAPSTHAIPGSPEKSPARVWRE